MLGIHQDVQNRLYDEVRDLKDRLGGKSLQAFDLDQLQYMDMVIKETLRLYPVGPVIFRKATADVPLGTMNKMNSQFKLHSIFSDMHGPKRIFSYCGVSAHTPRSWNLE